MHTKPYLPFQITTVIVMQSCGCHQSYTPPLFLFLRPIAFKLYYGQFHQIRFVQDGYSLT
jgi:hypothetical protein